MPSVGLVGGRGYVGREIIRCLIGHPAFQLKCVASSSLAGQPVRGEIPECAELDLTFEPADPDRLVDRGVDVWILALGNGEAAAYSETFLKAHSSVLDVSADFRCNPAWQYGLTEVFAADIAASRRVANPGCYATGIQLALWPVREWLVEPAIAFGVSGFSGAGRTPTPRNDIAALADNVMPYQLIEHSHERETARHLGRRVRLLPHVASFFRGISLTIQFQLEGVRSLEELHEAYRTMFAGQPFVKYGEPIPEIRQVRDTPLCRIGGLIRDPEDSSRWVITAALDNLSKGAATQAIQNINLMCGLEHTLGITRD
jgi:N-acetyl-gamma-glutamyl-phosphate reductase